MRATFWIPVAAIVVLGATGPAGAQAARGSEPPAPGAKEPGPEMVQVTEQLDRITRNRESSLQESLQQLLDKLVGPGKALVRVRLDLDFDRRLVRNHLLAPVTLGGKPVPQEREKNAFNREDAEVQIAPGKIRRMSVSVALHTSIRPDHVGKIRNLVSAAAGADPARRDTVVVEQLPWAP